MKLEEAKEILIKDRTDHHSFPTDKIGQAEQLGIEALKEVEEFRVWLREFSPGPLPGETEE